LPGLLDIIGSPTGLRAHAKHFVRSSRSELTATQSGTAGFTLSRFIRNNSPSGNALRKGM
jgi:hypothetical protein